MIMSNSKNNCPKWIMDEENNNLKSLKKEGEKEIHDKEKRIGNDKKHIETGAYENQYASNEKSIVKNKRIKSNEAIDNIQEYLKEPYFVHLELESDRKEDIFLTNTIDPPLMDFESGWIIPLSGGGDLAQKIADNYYNNTLKPIKYKGKLHKYSMFRNIVIDGGRLIDVFPLDDGQEEFSEDNISKISDMFLLEILRLRRNEKNMKDIISTIQKQQYEIISSETNKSFIVQGCAGSGKTAILAHRLHFMKGKTKINSDNTLIITPSVLFRSYSQGMMNRLKLNLIEQLTIEDYYLSELKQYDKYYSKHDKRVIYDISIFPDEYIRYAFSQKMLNLISDEAIAFIDSQINIAMKYNISVNDFGGTLKNKISKLITETQKYIEEWNEYNNQIKADPYYSNMEEEKKKSEKSIKKARQQMQKLSGQISREWERLSEQDTDERKIENRITNRITNLEQKYYEYKSICEENQKSLLDLKKEIKKHLDHKYNKYKNHIGKERIDDLKSARVNLSNIERRTFDEVLKNVINVAKSEYKVQSEDKYVNLKSITKIELWALVYIYDYINGNEILHKYEYICIDEGQTLNKGDYNLIKELQDKAAINIYGDKEQKMYSNIGISDWREIHINKAYNMDQNYRNPESVVKYSNEKTRVKMQGLGIKGEEVIEIDISEIDSATIDNHIESYNGEVVIIVKNRDAYDFLIKEYQGEYDIRYSTEHIIKYDEDIINVIPLHNVVGMEFTNVIVFEREMTSSQKYIAYTRTLNGLIVIKDTNGVRFLSNDKEDDELEFMESDQEILVSDEGIEIVEEKVEIDYIDYSELTTINVLYKKYSGRLNGPVVVYRRGWSADYCFVIESVSGRYAKGTDYKRGVPYAEKIRNIYSNGYSMYKGKLHI